jgi:hypothetical protein
MKDKTGILEHWTMTGRRVVLTGSEPVINSIVSQLGLPLDAPIRISDSRCVVALWGESLDLYLNQQLSHLNNEKMAPTRDVQTDVLISMGIA